MRSASTKEKVVFLNVPLPTLVSFCSSGDVIVPRKGKEQL